MKFRIMSEHEEKEAHGAHGHDDHGHGKKDDHGHGSKKKGNGGVLGFIQGILQKVLDTLSQTLRSFVAFAMAMFFLGALFGSVIPHISSIVGIEPGLLLGAPLVLAVLSYYFTEVAALIFILLLGVFLLFFL